MRGPDWDWGDQDGNSLGTVTSRSSDSENWCKVTWDAGSKNSYRVVTTVHSICVLPMAAVAAAAAGAAAAAAEQLVLILATKKHLEPVQDWILAHIHKIVAGVIVQIVIRHVTFAHLV